jgi:hypothetical protein
LNPDRGGVLLFKPVSMLAHESIKIKIASNNQEQEFSFSLEPINI